MLSSSQQAGEKVETASCSFLGPVSIYSEHQWGILNSWCQRVSSPLSQHVLVSVALGSHLYNSSSSWLGLFETCHIFWDGYTPACCLSGIKVAKAYALTGSGWHGGHCHDTMCARHTLPWSILSSLRLLWQNQQLPSPQPETGTHSSAQLAQSLASTIPSPLQHKSSCVHGGFLTPGKMCSRAGI